MPTITTTLYNKGKYQSGTSVQKTLKDEATTYFARVAIGNNGTGSLVTADGASKGVVALLGPQSGIGDGAYLFLYPEQKQWLGAPVVVPENDAQDDDGGAGQLYTCAVQTNPSVDLTSFGLNITGIGSSSVGIVRVQTYQISGSSQPAPANLPSGSSIGLTIVGTTSPVF